MASAHQRPAIQDRRRPSANDAEMAAILAHELRTPLTTIRTGLHLLDERRSSLDKRQRREVLTTVRAETERLARAVDAFVTGTEMEDPPMRTEPVSLQVVVPPIAARVAGQFRPSRIGVTIDPSTPPVNGDQDTVARMIENLIVAALSTDPYPPLVEVSVKAGPDEVLIRVGRPSSNRQGRAT